MDDVAGLARPLPSEVSIGRAIIEALTSAPRIIGARFGPGERMRVIIEADERPWELHLPAFVRGRLLIHFADVVELERDRPIERIEVVA